MPSSYTRILVPAMALLALLAGGLAVYTWLHWSPAGEVVPGGRVAHIELPHRLRDGPEHDEVLRLNGGNPYVLEIDDGDRGALLYYGASHSRDPGHPQAADITRRWNDFAPTVALYEGRSRGFFFGSLIEPFAGLPEPALVHKLARRDRTHLLSLEPAYADEVGILLRQFPAETLALYFFLRVYRSESGGVADDGLARELLRKRLDVDGLRGTLKTLDDVDRLWDREFDDQDDWRVERSEPGVLKAISDASRVIRGKHMTRILIDLFQRGERVLAVVGSGHVIRQEWNLREVFGLEPAPDQPLLERPAEP